VLGLVFAPGGPGAEAQPPAPAGNPDPSADAVPPAARAVRVEGLDDPTLGSALQVALGPWNIVLVGPGGTEAADPGTRLGAVVRTRVVAPRRLRVEVQPTPGPDGKDPAPLARELPVPTPLSEPDAASVALTVKTLLRNTSLAPPQERRASAVGDVGPGGESLVPDGHAAERGPREDEADGTSPGPGPGGTVGSLDTSLGTRLGAFSGDATPLAELRFAVGGGAWLTRGAVGPAGYAVFGVGGEVAAGAPLPVEGLGVEGRSSTVELILRADGLLVFPGLGSGAAVGLSLGAGARVGHLRIEPAGEGAGLDGRLVDDRITRVDPLLVVRATPALVVAEGVLVGLRLGLGVPLRRQRYEVRGRPLVTESPVGTEILVTCLAFFPRR